MTLDTKRLFDKKSAVFLSATILSLSVASMTSGCTTIEKPINHDVDAQLLKGSPLAKNTKFVTKKSDSNVSFIGESKDSNFAKLSQVESHAEDVRFTKTVLMPSRVERTPFLSPLGPKQYHGKRSGEQPVKVDELDSLKFAKLLTIAYKIPEKKADNFADWILEATYDVGVPEELLAGVIMAESTFDYYVVSSAGAVGPGQLKPKYWKDVCPKIKDPKHNVKCAATVLQHYYEDYCDKKWNCAIRTYNVGPTNMKTKKFARASKTYLNKVNGHTRALESVKKTPEGRIIAMMSVPEMLNKDRKEIQ